MGDPSNPAAPDGGPDSHPGTASGSPEPERHKGLLGGRFLAALAAVGLGVVAAVVIVSAGGDDEGSTTPGDAVDITALPDSGSDDTGSGADESEDSSDDEGTSGDAGGSGIEVALQGPVEVSASASESALVELVLHDPATPSSEGLEARHCVTVTLTGPAMVDTHECAAPAAPGTEAPATEAVLGEPGGAVVGCAAVATPPSGAPVTTTDATSRFLVVAGSELPPGDYEVRVEATSGSADGCAPSDEPDENGSVATFGLTVG